MTATLPVIFVSAIYSDEYHHRKAYNAGAIDFMSKPFIPEILLSKVKFFIELYQQRKALQQANLALAKLNTDKDNFFSSISHELQNPLNTLLDNAQLILQETDQLSYAQLQRLGQQNYTSTLTIYNLIETLMTWSTMQRMHLKQPFTEINLRNLAYQAIEVWREMANRKNIELLNDIQEEIYVYGDEMMLAAIIRNLLANSLKYTLSGDQVILSARPVEASGQDQERTRPSSAAIAVTDTGTGISPESLARLFRVDIPHTTPGTAQETGAGLGLIMCKEMVEYQGGRIWMESKLGQGTTVNFTMPLATDLARYV
jgi:signal transduction histidine kinase